MFEFLEDLPVNPLAFLGGAIGFLIGALMLKYGSALGFDSLGLIGKIGMMIGLTVGGFIGAAFVLRD